MVRTARNEPKEACVPVNDGSTSSLTDTNTAMSVAVGPRQATDARKPQSSSGCARCQSDRSPTEASSDAMKGDAFGIKKAARALLRLIGRVADAITARWAPRLHAFSDFFESGTEDGLQASRAALRPSKSTLQSSARPTPGTKGNRSRVEMESSIGAPAGYALWIARSLCESTKLANLPASSH